MRVKEILPWTIESPLIQLVQPSPAAPSHPRHHTLVLDRPVVPMPRREQADMLTDRQARQRETKKKNRNLNCDYYSPSIHQLSENNKTSKSFYDLRNKRPVSVDVGLAPEKASATYVARSKSLDESTYLERRKTSPNFEEILRDLCCDLKKNASCESSGPTSPRGGSVATKGSSSDSVFYDVALDEISTESSNDTVQSDLNPRKSFSEDTFDRHRKQLAKQRNRLVEQAKSKSRTTSSDSCDEGYEEIWKKLNPQERRRVSQMVDDLLLEIYRDKSTRPVRRRSCMAMGTVRQETAGNDKRPGHSHTSTEDNSYCTENTSGSDTFRYSCLQYKSVADLRQTRRALQAEVRHLGGRLVRQLCRRDCLVARRDWHCDWITAYLQANSEKRSEDTKTRFSVVPSHGDSGFTQWQNGMRMVARLPEGIPPQFRRTLWLNLAEKHLTSRGIQWQQVEEFCFNEFTNPDDEELGIQIVKDVHRTGCSLFCGVSGKDNQALLKRVLLAYARWNKAVGYCQGFNMLAALILQVMDRSEVDAVKVMIYLIEGVLPESYFANNLRGLSVDMAVFRDLLRIKLPILSRHFDQLQIDSKDSGTSYEPPLTNVFTMQWFLTLFCNCLPQETVLRVWDLIFLEGNHVLLATALAIWSTLAERILSVESADEFYCIMGVLTREMLEFGLMDANALIKAIVSFNLSELPELRERYLYNITPWTQSVSTVARRGLRLFYSDEDTDTEEDDDKIAIATAYGLFKSPKKKDGSNEVVSPPRALVCPDKEKIAMDISALTKQYRKLRERQKQAHVILTAACGTQSLVAPTSPAMNHLLMGKFALINNKGRRLGPPPGAIPPPSGSKPLSGKINTPSGETLHWKDTMASKKGTEKSSGDENSPVLSPVKDYSRRSSSSSSTSTELCDDPQRMSDSEDQTNSLSESYALPDVSGSSPLKSLLAKTPHSLDVESCREESMEPSITINSVITKDEVHHKTESNEESTISITPEGEDEKPQQKRKPSFKIDPEELRQLDRKLSLKIVEIERRKSSAGIESDDLNSVLFSFDRDYIQEVERTDRDSPASIPDDRLCSTDDFICGSDESITIPDLITTHKPLNYRMTSLEECDETNDIEIAENLLDVDTERSWEDCACNKSSLDNDGYDESQDDLSIIQVNYDDLFAQSSEYEEKISNNPSNNLEIVHKPNFEQVDFEQNILFTDAGDKYKINSKSFEPEQMCPMPNKINMNSEFEISTIDECHSPKIVFLANDKCGTAFLNKNSNPSFNLTNEIVNTDVLSYDSNDDPPCALLQPLNDPKNNLEKKLARLLPTISASTCLDSSSPDFTSLNSSVGCIKSIKEKYANFPQSSIDITEAAIVFDESNKFLSKLNLCYKSNESNFISNDDKPISQGDGSLAVKSFKEQEDDVISNNSTTECGIDEKSDALETNTECISVKTPLQNNLNLHRVESNVVPSPDKEDVVNMCYSKADISKSDALTQKESPKRRGSEVALSLILKENLQILSKIHQQSRRSSEICIESKNIPEDSVISMSEFVMFKNDTIQNLSEADRDDGKQMETSDVSENSNVFKNIDELSVNAIETEKLKYHSKHDHYVTSMHITEKKYNQLDDHNVKKTEIKTNYIYEKSNDLFDKKKPNSFDRSCKLPDLCNLDEKVNPSIWPKQLEHSVASITHPESNLMQTCLETKKAFEYSDKTHITEPNYYMKEKYISSPTKEENKHFTHYLKSNYKGDDGFDHNTHPFKPDIDLQYSNDTSPLFKVVDKVTNNQIENINSSDYNKVSDANEDILEELRSLDIEPDEVLDYFDPEDITHSTHLPNKINNRNKAFKELPDFENVTENNLIILSKPQHGTFPNRSIADNKGIYNRSLDIPTSSKAFSSNLRDKKQMSFDFSSEFNGSSIKNKFNASKSYSVDTVIQDKISSENYLTDTRTSNVKYTDFDQNNIFSTDNTNYHKNVTEEIELNTQKSSKDFLSQYGIKSSLENIDECVYSLKVNESPSENPTSSRQSRFSERIDYRNREKLLIKYKSEDFSGRVSPTHYRFSSASPIRKSLTSPSSEPSFRSNIIADRAKSSSPIPDTSLNRQHVSDKNSDCGIQEYDCRGTKEVKKYFRTESLDLNPNKEDFTKVLKKKAESFETFSNTKVWKEKKSPTSPVKFNPFPARSYSRQPRDLGVKLGLYLPTKTEKSPTKHLT